MKRIMVIMLALGLAIANGANATGNVKGVSPRARVVVVAPYYYGYAPGFGLRYSPFYNPYSPFYNPFTDPFYRSGTVERVPSELQLKIDEINNNYSYQISSARRDKFVSKAERKQKIRELKHQRESAIIAAKRSYYNSERKTNA